MGYTWDNLIQTNSNEKKSLSIKLNEVEGEFYSLRKRHALGQVNLDIYDELSTQMFQQRESKLKQLEKLNKKLSNPKLNSVIGYISEIARDLENKKSRPFKNFSKKTGPVPGMGLEPIRLRTRPSNVLVYQFQHPGIYCLFKNKLISKNIKSNSILAF